MEKTRVPKGEMYWKYCLLEDMIFQVQDRYDETSNYDFKLGNYFHTQEEAESMARKLRAVLKGADVIEMPSEEEIRNVRNRIEDDVVYNIRDAEGYQLIYCTAINKGAELMANWFKSKIVK